MDRVYGSECQLSCQAWLKNNPVNVSFLSCGFTIGYGAAWKEAKVEKGSSVAVLGLGAVGLGVCIVKKHDSILNQNSTSLTF